MTGVFLSTKFLDLWCVTEMQLVNSIAVISLDSRKHTVYRRAGGMNWMHATHLLIFIICSCGGQGTWRAHKYAVAGKVTIQLSK